MLPAIAVNGRTTFQVTIAASRASDTIKPNPARIINSKVVCRAVRAASCFAACSSSEAFSTRPRSSPISLARIGDAVRRFASDAASVSFFSPIATTSSAANRNAPICCL